MQTYYTANDTAEKRKATPYSKYTPNLRKDEGVGTSMDLWKDVFDDFVKADTAYGGAFLLSKTSKMIQNRVRMYLYKLFMVHLCKEYEVVKPNTPTSDILKTLKDISKSGKVRDTIMNRVVNSYGGGNLDHLETTLFPIIDLKMTPLIRALIAEYRNGRPINPDDVAHLLYTEDLDEAPDSDQALIASLRT
jgi:hypothetical protein